MDSELETLLHEVQWKAHKLITVCSMAGTTRGRDMAGEIRTQIATYRQQKKMGQEATSPDRYDLASLAPPVALDAEDDTEHPDFED